VDKVQYGSLQIADYINDPLHASQPWQFHLMFDASRPISASPSLSIDSFNNTWVYAGTGRLFDSDADSDYFSQEAEFLYGVKDPFFNNAYNGSYYKNYLIPPLTLTETDLFDADPFLVLNTGQVYKDSGAGYQPYKYFDLMVQEDARPEDGWRRTLHSETIGSTTSYMRSLNKPTIIGGLSLFSTFMPTGETCQFGGKSSLYILYYETGTAFKRPVARGGIGLETVEVDGDASTEEEKVKDYISLGSGSTSSVGIHIGRQNQRYSDSGDNPEGDMVTGFVQQGTGNIVELDIETALKVRSGLRAWRQRE
jgi:type IV pilus assembly protein PilY1